MWPKGTHRLVVLTDLTLINALDQLGCSQREEPPVGVPLDSIDLQKTYGCHKHLIFLIPVGQIFSRLHFGGTICKLEVVLLAVFKLSVRTSSDLLFLGSFEMMILTY